MNVTRILVGGLLAGVFLTISEGILNAGILMDDYQAMMEGHGLVEASWAMTGYVAGTFVFGFAVAFLYAAIRPRFGPGWQTAVIAGLPLWAVGYCVPTIWFGAMGLLAGPGATTLALVWGLVEMLIAAMIAGWLYQEGSAAEASVAGRS